MQNRSTVGAWTLAVIGSILMLMTGCGQDNLVKSQLDEGYTSLEAKQYDDAISHADTVLQQHPSGTGSAEAFYLKGRALEQKPVGSQSEAGENLRYARSMYIEALNQSPAPKLEAYIHTSLANVAYFQDDYPTAISQWTAAYDKLDDPNLRSWVLYRVGICKQRTGDYVDADKIFMNVQQQYPNTVPAQRAREHQGVHAFSVQMATFANAAEATAAINELHSQGALASKQIDAKGRSVVLVGPLSSYQQALAAKQRFAGKYPYAVIVP